MRVAFTRLREYVVSILRARIIQLVLVFLFAEAAVAVVPPVQLCLDNGTNEVCSSGGIGSSSGLSNPGGAKAPSSVNKKNFHPGHYVIIPSSKMHVYMNYPPSWLVGEKLFRGIRVVYDWIDLEPKEGVYDFSDIDKHVRYAKQNGLQIFIFVRYMSHTVSANTKPKTPKYMWGNPKYGCDPRYHGSYKKIINTASGKQVWYPCFHNQNVANKRHALYTALGRKYNSEPAIEGLQIDETSVCPECGKKYGLTVDRLRKAFEDAARVAKKAFPDKTVIQKITAARYDLDAFARYLVGQNVGIGATDIYINKTNRGSSMYRYSYGSMIKYHDVVPSFPEAQLASFTKHNKAPAPGDKTIAESVYKAAVRETNPWYMGWIKQEPIFSDQILPALRKYGELPAAKKFYSK